MMKKKKNVEVKKVQARVLGQGFYDRMYRDEDAGTIISVPETLLPSSWLEKVGAKKEKQEEEEPEKPKTAPAKTKTEKVGDELEQMLAEAGSGSSLGEPK